MPRRILIILSGLTMQNNKGGAAVYITYLQLGYILHADALKFDLKLTNKKNAVCNKLFL